MPIKLLAGSDISNIFPKYLSLLQSL